MRKVWIVFTLVIILFSTGCQQTEEDGASIKALEKGSKDPQKKVVLVMIDSMTSKIIDRTREKGTIPSLNFLIENGQYYKELVAPFPTMSVVIESSLLTGEMPDKHGIPGLNWYNFAENRYIDYGTSIEKMIKLDPDQSIEDSLYHLNNIHLNKHTPTIFEELNKIGYSTGAVNFIIYRGPKSHSVSVPSLFEEALDLPEEIQTKGPDILSFGQLVEPKAVQELQLPDSVFHKLGLNDAYSVEATKALIKAGEQPDFLAIFLPDFDREAHVHSPHYLRGFERAETLFQEILNSYDSWEQALEENVFIILGDHGQDKLVDDESLLTIDLETIYRDLTIAPISEDIHQYDIGFANNHRMTYVFAPNHLNHLEELAEMALMDERIELAAWIEDGWVKVRSPFSVSSFSFRPNDKFKDTYTQQWSIEGDEKIVDITISNDSLTYNDYPDVLNHLYSALHTHDQPTLILTARPGHSFFSEGAPVHVDGGEHGGIHKNDTNTALIISGTDKEFKNHRIVDLKQYILSLFEQ